MSDDKETPEAATSAAEASPPQGGARLADARRALQISVAEIAKELHLDEPKVHALERNEFDVLGAPVFAKGHLRKYAQLVRVDESDVMADYYELTRTAGMPPLLTTRRKPRREMAPGPWIAVIVVAILLASIYWWISSRPPAAVAPSPDEAQQESNSVAMPVAALDDGADSGTVEPSPESAADAADGAAVEPVETDEVDDSDVLAAVAAASATDAAPSRQTPQLEDGQVRLLVSYRGDCWTEITDAGGRRLFFDLGKEGRTVELSGESPLNVLFGNADNVAIRVNGVARNIRAAERRGRTARLTITGT